MLWPIVARIAGAALFLAVSAFAFPGNPSLAADLYHDDMLDVRWDNTLNYTAAFRLLSRDATLISNPNWDDGDRNFAPGVVANRLDLLSELEVTAGDYGLRLSGAAWYDTVYNQRNDNDSPATFNPFSVSHNQFTTDVRDLQGRDARLNDAFVHGSFDVGDLPVSFRLGRYALLWGESVFFAENSIAAGQAPTDVNRELSELASYTKENFLPVWQSSITLQPWEDVSLSGYYQFAWRKDELPGSGSYFSYRDFEDVGGERIILAPGEYLYRARNMLPPDDGQFGVSLQVSGSEFNYGFYAMRFDAKDPKTYAYLGVGSRGDGSYRLVYPADIQLYGASFSTYVGDSDVAGEISYRRNMPLISDPQVVPAGVQADNENHPLYPVGDTLHGQVSSDTTFSSSSLWQRAELNVEVAANERLSVTKNRAAMDSYADRYAVAFHANFTPEYFQVLPGLDVSLPLGLGYGLSGNSSTDDTQCVRCGNLEIGVAATYRTVWRGSVSFTHFIGPPDRQLLADRDFIQFNMQRTF